MCPESWPRYEVESARNPWDWESRAATCGSDSAYIASRVGDAPRVQSGAKDLKWFLSDDICSTEPRRGLVLLNAGVLADKAMEGEASVLDACIDIWPWVSSPRSNFLVIASSHFSIKALHPVRMGRLSWPELRTCCQWRTTGKGGEQEIAASERDARAYSGWRSLPCGFQRLALHHAVVLDHAFVVMSELYTYIPTIGVMTDDVRPAQCMPSLVALFEMLRQYIDMIKQDSSNLG